MSTDDRSDDIRTSDRIRDAVGRKAGSAGPETDTAPTETTMGTDPAAQPADTTTTQPMSTSPSPADTAAEPVGSTAAPTAPATGQATRERGIRVGTVVWGLVIAAVGVGLIAYVSGVRFDVELAMIILVAAAGLALLGGSLLSNRRRRG